MSETKSKPASQTSRLLRDYSSHDNITTLPTQVREGNPERNAEELSLYIMGRRPGNRTSGALTQSSLRQQDGTGGQILPRFSHYHQDNTRKRAKAANGLAALRSSDSGLGLLILVPGAEF